MNNISDLIGELLIQHNCVVVPSFGGFVAKQTSATIDYQSGTMLPPRKSLLFNRQLITNDGLLISALAHRGHISYESAQEMVAETVKTWQRQLQSGERIVLDQVGYLFLDAEKNIGFEQDRHVNLLLEAYGLGKVHFIAEEDLSLLNHATAVQPTEAFVVSHASHLAPESADKEEMAPIVPHPGLVRRKVWKYIAAAALVPVAFYSYWIPMKTRVLESGILAIQDFNPFQSSEQAVYQSATWQFDWQEIPKHESLDDMLKQVAADASVFSYPFDEDLYIPIRLHNSPAASLDVIEPVEKVATPSGAGDFYLIVGWFSTQSNANELLKSLRTKGMDAEILPHNNGFRVSAARNTNSDFSSQQKALQELGLSGWVLQK